MSDNERGLAVIAQAESRYRLLGQITEIHTCNRLQLVLRCSCEGCLDVFVGGVRGQSIVRQRV